MTDDVFAIVGTVIAGVYQVERVVAEGGFSVVYRAHHLGSQTPVALELLKVPQQSATQQAQCLALLRSEAQLLYPLSASLPALVRPQHVDAFSAANGRLVPYLVLEWLEGMTLGALIEQRELAGLPPVSLRKLVRLLTPVARALERVHHFDGPEGRGSIVHGDLQPENLFVAQVEGEEVVKILDFGIRKVMSAAGQIAGIMNQDGPAAHAFTSPHAAPEQWAPRHYGRTGPWTDVWGLALSMVLVLAGRLLAVGDGKTRMDIALDASRRPTPRSEGILLPDAIERVFARGLALEPRMRQPDVGVFWDELTSALALSDADRGRTVPSLVLDLEFDPLAPTARAPSARVHEVPDLELTPVAPSRRPSGAGTVQAQVWIGPSVLTVEESGGAGMPSNLDLDLPADEPMSRRSLSSQRILLTQPVPASPGALPALAVGTPSTSLPARTSSRAPASGVAKGAGLSAQGALPTAAERNHSSSPRAALQRLRPAFGAFAAALVVAIADLAYAAATGEVLTVLSLRLSVFAGALLVAALGLGLRELVRGNQSS